MTRSVGEPFRSMNRLLNRLAAGVHRCKRLPSVEFHVPISPNENFFTMSHYLAASLRRRGGWLARSPVVITVGADCSPYDLYDENPWSRRYPIRWVWVNRDLFREKTFFATALERFRADFASDVVIMLDADLLVVGDLSDLVRQVTETRALYGLIAHVSPFLLPAGATSRPNSAWWEELFLRSALGQPEYSCQHTGWGLMFSDANYRACPPYFNFGVLAAPAEVMRRLGKVLYDEMANVETVLDTIFKCQLGLTLAVTRLGIPWRELSPRYNFPNYSSFWSAYPDEGKDLRILHYLGREEGFRKNTDMAGIEAARSFLLREELPPVNARLQSELRVLQPVVEEEG